MAVVKFIAVHDHVLIDALVERMIRQIHRIRGKATIRSARGKCCNEAQIDALS